MEVALPFATAEDLAERWRPLSDAEKPRADALLSDASYALAALMPEGWEGDPSVTADLLRMVCCNVVKREMQPNPLGVDAPAMSQVSQTAGSFSVNATLANPTGDIYLTDTEKKLLHVGEARCYSVVAEIGYRGGRPWLC